MLKPRDRSIGSDDAALHDRVALRQRPPPGSAHTAMRLLSANEMLAVDMGTHTVKVMTLSERKGRWRIDRFHTIQTGINAQTPQDQVTPRQGAALMALLKTAGVRARECVGAIQGRSVFFRPLRIPSVGGERLDRIVRYEARQQIPFALDQVIYDFHQFKGGDLDVDITLVAAKKELVNEYVDTMRNAGLSVEYLDVSTLALFNSFVGGHPGMVNDVVAVVDIGAATTDIVISSEGALRFMRSAPIAGNHLTQSVAGVFAIPLDEAEQLKCRTFATREDGEAQNNLLHPGDNRVVDAVNRSMEDIVNEVRRSLDFFVSRPEGVPVNAVILTGGTANIPGICDFFEERLGVDVLTEPGYSIDGIDLGGLEAEHYLSAGVALGLALKASGKATVDMNFTPVTIRQTQAMRERRPSFLLEGVLVGIVIALLITNVVFELNLNRRVLENVKNFVLLTGRVQEDLRNAIQTNDELHARLEKLTAIADNRGFLTAIWGEVSRLKPESVWVESSTMTVESLGVQGRAEQERHVQDFSNNLSISPYFEGVSIREMKRERGTVRYTLDIGSLTHPDPEAVAFINGIRKYLRESKSRQVVQVRTAALIKTEQRAEVYYTHAGATQEMIREMHHAVARALVEAGQGRDGNIEHLELVAFDARGQFIFAVRVDYKTVEQLYKGEISYEDFRAQFKNVMEEVLRRLEEKHQREQQEREARTAQPERPEVPADMEESDLPVGRPARGGGEFE